MLDSDTTADAAQCMLLMPNDVNCLLVALLVDMHDHSFFKC